MGFVEKYGLTVKLQWSLIGTVKVVFGPLFSLKSIIRNFIMKAKEPWKHVSWMMTWLNNSFIPTFLKPHCTIYCTANWKSKVIKMMQIENSQLSKEGRGCFVDWRRQKIGKGVFCKKNSGNTALKVYFLMQKQLFPIEKPLPSIYFSYRQIELLYSVNATLFSFELCILPLLCLVTFSGLLYKITFMAPFNYSSAKK